MTIGALSASDLHYRLRAGRLLLQLGPMVLRLEADQADFAAALQLLYPTAGAPDFSAEVADATLQLRREGPGLFRWLIDGQPTDKSPFISPLTLANFEWAIHHALATRLAPALAFHAAVAAHPDGRAVALIGESGSGKSTLAAGLVADGWKLVADEYLVFAPGGDVLPVPGPITLKAEAITLIRARGGSLRFGPTASHPERGEICQVGTSHTASPEDKIQVAALIFPSFVAGESALLARSDQPTAFQRLVDQSHNRHILGPAGFRQLCAVARIPSWTLTFGQLDQALDALRSTLDCGE